MLRLQSGKIGCPLLFAGAGAGAAGAGVRLLYLAVARRTMHRTAAVMAAAQRTFNLVGPSDPDLHFTVDPIERYSSLTRSVLNLDTALNLVGAGKKKGSYWVVYGPRQSMKTSSLLALQERLNSYPNKDKPEFSCVYVSAQGVQTDSLGDPLRGKAILASAVNRACPVRPYPNEDVLQTRLSSALPDVLEEWSKQEHARGRKVVLLLDEYDTLEGDVLVSVTSTLRSGYPTRPSKYPSSVVLCGMRDLRNALVRTKKDGTMERVIPEGSPFNIAEEVGIERHTRNFTRDEITALYAQWTAEGGPTFDEAAIDVVLEWTGGHPWLVNRFGKALQMEMSPTPKQVTAGMVSEAGHELAGHWDKQGALETHFDSLVSRLAEDTGVRYAVSKALGSKVRVMAERFHPGCTEQAIDLGLLKEGSGEVANMTYRLVLPIALERIRAKKAGFAEEVEQYHNLFFDPTTRRLRWTNLVSHVGNELIPSVFGWSKPNLTEREVKWTVLMAASSAINSKATVQQEVSSGMGQQTDLFVKRNDDASLSEAIEIKYRNASDAEIDAAVSQAGHYAVDRAATRATVLFFDNSAKQRFPIDGNRVYQDERTCPDTKIKVDLVYFWAQPQSASKGEIDQLLQLDPTALKAAIRAMGRAQIVRFNRALNVTIKGPKEDLQDRLCQKLAAKKAELYEGKGDENLQDGRGRA